MCSDIVSHDAKDQTEQRRFLLSERELNELREIYFGVDGFGQLIDRDAHWANLVVPVMKPIGAALLHFINKIEDSMEVPAEAAAQPHCEVCRKLAALAEKAPRTARLLQKNISDAHRDYCSKAGKGGA